MKAYSVLLVEDVGNVRVVSLNRPHRMNAFDVGQALQLLEALREACSDPSIRALVITGEGNNFCTGADLKRDRAEEQRLGIDILKVMQDVFLLLNQGDKPSICALNGHAMGAGLSLALACDFIVADQAANLAASFTGVGLVPDMGITQTLPARVGVAAARDMLLLGSARNAADALALGLVDWTCDAGQSKEIALEKAAALAARAPLAVAATRRMMAGQIAGIELALRDELQIQQSLRETADAKEAAAAFAQKRLPVFQGH